MSSAEVGVLMVT